MSVALDALRKSHQSVVDYETAREKRRGKRQARELRPHVENIKKHLAQWDRVAAQADSQEASPLQALLTSWTAPAVATEPAAPAPKASKASAKKPAAPKAPAKKAEPMKSAPKGKPAKESKAPTSSAKQDEPKAPSAAKPGLLERMNPFKGAGKPTTLRDITAAGQDDGTEGDDAEVSEGIDLTDKILGKGDWLKSHAKIIREQIPKVKACAADPEKYLKAKAAFLDRCIPKLREYIKAPGKQHSPLFAYCILFLSDHGEVGMALELAERALELQQTSPIKRNYHELNFDVRLMHFEREALEVGKAGLGPRFDAFTDLRKQLMNDQFRGHHAKAKVAKAYAEVCMALEQWADAKTNLQEVRLLNPNTGVSTMMATCEAKLNPKQ